MKKFLVLIGIICVLALTTACGKEEEINRYFVTFDTNGGTSVKRQVVIEGSHATIPVEPTKLDYAFAGWYLDDKLYDFNEPVYKNIKLTAHWNEIIHICDNTCKSGYTLDKNCNCIKDKTTTTKTKSTTKKKNIIKKSTLYLNESNITIVIGKKVYIESYSNETVNWLSSNNTIVEVSNGYILGKNSGNAIITAYTSDNQAQLKVRVITEDRERLEALASIMQPKVIKSIDTNLLYSFNGCSVFNTANITELQGITIENGIVTSLNKNLYGTVISAYTITCGTETDNISVEHIVNSV